MNGMLTDSETSGYSSEDPTSSDSGGDRSDDDLEKTQFDADDNIFGLTANILEGSISDLFTSSSVAEALRFSKLEAQRTFALQKEKIRQLERQSQGAQDRSVDAALKLGKTKREIRKLKNRLSAVRSRQRKELENESCRLRVVQMTKQAQLYEQRIQELLEENKALRRAQRHQNDRVDWSHESARTYRATKTKGFTGKRPRSSENSRCSTVFEPAEFGTAISGTPMLETRATCLTTRRSTSSTASTFYHSLGMRLLNSSQTMSNLQHRADQVMSLELSRPHRKSFRRRGQGVI